MDVMGKEVGLLFRLMQSTGLRARATANNVANLNTPGYKRQAVRFEEELRAALDDGKSTERIAPEVVELQSSVSLEEEMNAMRENRLLYETYSSILAGHFELLRTSISNNG